MPKKSAAKMKAVALNKPRLRLSGQDGNIFFIMASASRAAQDAGWPEERIDEFVRRVESSDSYTAALRVVMSEFSCE